ncbi:serine/threonine-protein kinase 31-like [Bombina bombina]|uniref:serine/threonine-protein kinase 31-like n=1 Tax=Bombina bombina TaxID=8345 RepID=UPI00235A91B7|nr:serine/threonine-protein kinase 31-like [Bombina bombina]
MSGVAQGLQILHAANIIVGSLHENNIFAINRERGIIGDFDFTKDGAQRSSSSSVSFPHLRAPELTMGHPASMSSDMYAYGCILLWLYTRNKEFSFKDDGTISLHGLGLDSKLEYLLSHLLCSRDRMQAENVKSHEYFQMTEERVNPMSDGETQHIPADFA